MIQEFLFNLFKFDFDNKVYPLVANQKIKPPWLCYTIISAVREDVFCGQTATTYSIQLDYYTSIHDDAVIAEDKIINLLSTKHATNIESYYSYEDDTSLYRLSIEFLIMF